MFITNLLVICLSTGGTEERSIMERALQECGNWISRIYMNTQFKKVIIKLNVSDESPMIGSPFEYLRIYISIGY